MKMAHKRNSRREPILMIVFHFVLPSHRKLFWCNSIHKWSENLDLVPKKRKIKLKIKLPYSSASTLEKLPENLFIFLELFFFCYSSSTTLAIAFTNQLNAKRLVFSIVQVLHQHWKIQLINFFFLLFFFCLSLSPFPFLKAKIIHHYTTESERKRNSAPRWNKNMRFSLNRMWCVCARNRNRKKNCIRDEMSLFKIKSSIIFRQEKCPHERHRIKGNERTRE